MRVKITMRRSYPTWPSKSSPTAPATSPGIIVEQFGITVVPAYVLFGEESFRQGIDINPTQFYQRLTSSPQFPGTSQPTPGDFTEKLEPLVAEGHQVLCITVPRKLSGTYNSATQAATQFDDGAVTIIDSGTASAGHMLEVIAAAEDAAAPDATLESVASAARTRAAQAYGYVAVDTLEYLQKGGRIGKAQAFMGSILKVKPILRVSDGEVMPIDRPRNQRRALQRLEELVREQAAARPPSWPSPTPPTPPPPRRCATACPTWPSADQTYTVQIGSAIGAHVGPGAVAVSTLP